MNMRKISIDNILMKIAHEYPADIIKSQVKDIPRIAFHICLALESAKPIIPSELAICDLGGGIGLFSVGCAALGFKRVVLIDDFNDAVNLRFRLGDGIFTLHRRYGVEVISRDVISRGISDVRRGFDVITTFDSMEHWHHSPKKLFQEVIAAMNPGGTFILGVPNCVNMRKRITVPLGIGKWSSMQDWYEPEMFRGHVREADTDDLKYISHDMGLTNVRIYGRNWLGHYSPKLWIRIAAMILDYPLRVIPCLCSDLYLVGNKPNDINLSTLKDGKRVYGTTR